MNLADKQFEQRLIASINQGDTEAMEVVYFEYRSWVYAIAYKLINNHADADEITHDVFRYFFDRFPDFELSGTIKGFLYPVIRNKSIDLARKRKPTINSEILEHHADKPIRHPEQERNQVEELVASLPSEQRELVIMRFVDGFSLNEIAEALSIPLGTVKSRLHKSLKELRTALALLILSGIVFFYLR